MERTYIRDVAAKAEQEVLVRGFTENFRDGKSMAFLVIKDITGKVQVTIEKELHPEWADTLAQITQDTVVSVTGIVKLSEFVKLNGIEIIPTFATASSTIPTPSSWKARSPCASARAFRKTPKAPSAHRALPGPGVYRFGFSRKADALTRKRKATQRAAFPPNLTPALMSLPSVALSSDASKSTFMVTPSPPFVNIQRRGDTA